MIGLSHQRVNQLRAEGKLPKPFALVKGEKREDELWRACDIEKWNRG